MVKSGNVKISIVTVSYNAVKTIEQTILSVGNQIYENIEYIIIDGGSTDGTVDVIKKYENKIAYWVSEPDKGIYDAMNKGIDLATGEWIYFLCSGDTLTENVLSKIDFGKLGERYQYIYGKVFMNDIQKIHGKKYNVYTLARGNICQQSVFYKKSIFNFIDKHNLNFVYLADWDLNIRCFAHSNINTCFIDEIIAIYEGNGASVCNRDYKFWENYNRIIIDNFGISRFVLSYCMNFILDKLYLGTIIRIIINFFRK